MALITFIGGDETGNVANCDWGRFRFTINTAVECDDPHIIAKASANRFFRVEAGPALGSQPTPEAMIEASPIPASTILKLDPLAKARAAKAAKRASEAGDSVA